MLRRELRALEEKLGDAVRVGDAKCTAFEKEWEEARVREEELKNKIKANAKVCIYICMYVCM